MKRRIFVVDDQAAVMETAVVIIRSGNPEWEVTGFKDPVEALGAVKANPPDLILSDQLMPGMQGSQLLELVRGIAPRTIRIAMSGYVPLNKMALITSAHQFMSKPFDATKLRDTIRRSFAAQDRVTDDGLRAITTSLRSIPSLPQAHHALLRELEDDRSASSNIARLVSEDAGLTAKVLQLANSPLFTQGYVISNPSDAVMCLGTDLIAAVVLAQSLFRHYASLAHWEINLQQVWTHCWRTAHLAQHICRAMRFARRAGEEAFLAGLLHETGRFILVDNFPKEYHAACEAARSTNSPLGPRLKEIFHTTPSQIAAYILELWGMPTPVIDAIAGQDNPGANGSNEFNLTAALYIANGISSRQSPPDALQPEDWNEVYLESLGCREKIAEWETISLEPGAAA